MSARGPCNLTRAQQRAIYSQLEEPNDEAPWWPLVDLPSADDISRKALCFGLVILAIGLVMAWAINGG